MCPQLTVDKSINAPECPLCLCIHLSAFSERGTKREGKSVLSTDFQKSGESALTSLATPSPSGLAKSEHKLDLKKKKYL